MGSGLRCGCMGETVRAHTVGGRLRRREFVGRLLELGACSAGLALLSSACGALAAVPQPRQPARIGVLGRGPANPRQVAFEAGLEELGWIKGQNIAIEFADHGGRAELLPALAAELVRKQPDLILAPSAPEALEAQHATRTIPIVFATVADPVTIGLVASFARPGGNITGQSTQSAQLVPKRLELLKGLLPGLTRLTALRDGRNSSSAVGQADLERVAGQFGVQVETLDVRSLADLEAAFGRIHASRPDALLFASESLFLSQLLRPIVDGVTTIGRPAIYAAREFVDAGGLMAHGPNMNALNQRAATYVDRILRGAMPADLPVEQATTFEFAVNAKTAETLGLIFPPDVAAQVTDWVA